MIRDAFIILIVASNFVLRIYSQDIHWSQFNDNPIFQNPAETGSFYGDTRFIGNFRDQWRSVTIPYQTFSFSIDRKWKGISYGFLGFHDQAGDGKMRTLEVQGNLAKSIKLTSDSIQNIRLGINVGMNHRQVNTDAFYFDAQYNGYIFNPLLSTNENFQSDRKTNASIGIGCLYSYSTSFRNYLKIGISGFNLNRPNQGFYQETIHRDIRMTAQIKYCRPITENLDIMPSLQFSKQGTYNELLLGSSIRYYLPGSSRNYIYKALMAGLWLRGKDASILTVGYEYQDLFVGLSYDINFSKLVPASRARGGFEIAVRYILFRYRPKQIDHRVCPDFI